jgi:hypothetical protein
VTPARRQTPRRCCLASERFSMRSPRSLSTLRQYSNSRRRTGSRTLFSSWPTKLSTSRSRTASSITQWARVRACRIRLSTVALLRTCRVTADLSPYPTRWNCAYLPAFQRLSRRHGRLTTHSFPRMPSWEATHTGTLSARESASRGQGTFVECTDQP